MVHSVVNTFQNIVRPTHCHIRRIHTQQASRGMALPQLTGMKLSGRRIYSVDESGLLRVVRLVLRSHQHTVSKTSNLKCLIRNRNYSNLRGIVNHSLRESIADCIFTSVGISSHCLNAVDWLHEILTVSDALINSPVSIASST